MKIIITESQKKLLFENSAKDSLIEMIKEDGWESAADFVGGIENLKYVVGIDTPKDFLNLFNDLDVVQSEENPNLTLFRYEKGNNVIMYDRENRVMFINLYKIWSFLEEGFGLNNSERQDITKEWADDVYSLLVTSTFGFLMNTGLMVDDDYNLQVTGKRSFSTRLMTGWRISTI
jgi:hypothetical protein